MDVSEATNFVELALIEVEYLAADARLSLGEHPADEEARRIASYLKAANKALEASLDALKTAKNLSNRALVA